jgi:hypothetical protein
MARDQAGGIDQTGCAQIGHQRLRRIALEELGGDERDLRRHGVADGLAPVGQVVRQGRGGVDHVDQPYGTVGANEIVIARRQVATHVVGRGGPSLADRMGQQQAGERLGDRTDLVDAALRRRRAGVARDDAGVVEARASAQDDRGGDAVGAARPNEIRDERSDRVGRSGRLRHARKRQREHRRQGEELASRQAR